MNRKQDVATVAMIAVVLMAAALTSSVANAQTAMQAKFTLPCTTYWADAKLPAGEYTVIIRSFSATVDMIEVRGEGTVRHMTLGISEQRSEGSSLTLAHSNGVAVAQTLYLTEKGRKFNLPAAKEAKELLAKSQPAAIERTKITVAAE